ncbi:MAG: hypothetical protein IPO90_13000 [Flavobacteriales bacterium]|nr:hypothetical protein [Flavobacteriales bacterium]
MRVLATTVDSGNRENVELVPEKHGPVTPWAMPIRSTSVFCPPSKCPSWRDRKYRTFRISGDSMAPVSDGSWVTGEYVSELAKRSGTDSLIVVTKEDGIVFKVVDNKLKENGTLLLRHQSDPFALRSGDR